MERTGGGIPGRYWRRRVRVRAVYSGGGIGEGGSTGSTPVFIKRVRWVGFVLGLGVRWSGLVVLLE